MNILLYHSQENLELARAEAESLIGKISRKDKFISIIKSENCELLKRLALTKESCELLLVSEISELIEKVTEFDFKINNRYSVIARKGKEEREVFNAIWKSLKAKGHEPEIDLENPETQIMIYHAGKKAYVGKLINRNHEEFEKRRVHLRPAPHPTSLHPKIARALVNLTGIKRGVLVDPFCGSGGFLIEAGLMGLKVKGYDISKELISKCEKNLKGYGVKDYSLEIKDAFTISEEWNYAIMDLPYGRNTPPVELEKMFPRILRLLENDLKKKAVVGVPDSLDHEKFKTALKLDGVYEDYVAKGLTRRFLVFSRE